MLEFVNRRNSNCYKWDSEQACGTLPLWVADMDFKAAPCIIDALQRRLDHGVFGYGIVPDEYYEAVSRWFSSRHGWHGISKQQLLPVIGVVPAIAAILHAMNDSRLSFDKPLRVLTITPAYNCFFRLIENAGATLLSSPLKPVELPDNEIYFEVDWDDFSEKAAVADVFLLCNPHNPTGRVWKREELSRMAQICEQNRVYVISDEIHCEFCFPAHHYIPFATIATSNRYCVCTSASKAFNIAGLQCANIFVPDEDMHLHIEHALDVCESGELNPFGPVAAIAAYTDGAAWLDELNSHIYDNYLFLRRYVSDNLPEFTLTRSEGTYLAWLRLPLSKTQEGANRLTAEAFCQELAAQEHVLFNPSEMYHGEGFVRINLATSRAILAEALDRLRHFVC